jgi:hypothetical protein
MPSFRRNPKFGNQKNKERNIRENSKLSTELISYCPVEMDQSLIKQDDRMLKRRLKAGEWPVTGRLQAGEWGCTQGNDSALFLSIDTCLFVGQFVLF